MVFDREIITKSAKETADLGQELASSFLTKGEWSGKPPIICLYGELGSGKTTFAQGFAKGLGLVSRLPSPTFIIVRRYRATKTRGFFYHLDLYRIKNERELAALGLTEIFDEPKAYVLVEWAEKLGSLTPRERLDVSFRVKKEEHLITLRKINYD